MRKLKLIIVSCVLVVCGCRYMDEDKSFTLDEVEVSIIEYMETKYGQEFELVDIGYNSIISKEVNARVILLEDKRKNEINVNWIYEDGEELVNDDYTELLYKKELNDMMDSLVEEQFHEYEYATYSLFWNEVELNGYYENISFKSLAKVKKIDIDTTILMNESMMDKDEKVEMCVLQLYEKLKHETTDDVHISIHILVYDNDTFYENEPLIQQFKSIFTIDVRDIPLTYYESNRIILKEFYFTSNDIEAGVEVR